MGYAVFAVEAGYGARRSGRRPARRIGRNDRRHDREPVLPRHGRSKDRRPIEPPRQGDSAASSSTVLPLAAQRLHLRTARGRPQRRRRHDQAGDVPSLGRRRRRRSKRETAAPCRVEPGRPQRAQDVPFARTADRPLRRHQAHRPRQRAEQGRDLRSRSRLLRLPVRGRTRRRGAERRFEIAGADMAPGTEQLPGTTLDWQTAQHWVEFSGKDAWVVWSPIEAPLVQFGDINTGKWQKTLNLTNAWVFSYAMNNYWMTNFKASQEGRVEFRYSLTSGPALTSRAGGGAAAGRVSSSRFGWETHTPLVATWIPAGNKAPIKSARSPSFRSTGRMSSSRRFGLTPTERPSSASARSPARARKLGYPAGLSHPAALRPTSSRSRCKPSGSRVNLPGGGVTTTMDAPKGNRWTRCR